MNTNRYAFIISNIKTNGGFITSDALARILGKRHDNVIRKLTKEIGTERLLKMRSRKNVFGGNGAKQEQAIYLLPDDVAVPLAATYDMTVCAELFGAFKEILRSQFKILNANALAEAQRLALEAIDAHRKLVYLGEDLETENDVADVARARLNRRSMPDDL